MTHEVERASFAPELVDLVVGDVPYRHAVGTIAQRIMIGYRSDAPNHAQVLQTLHALHHLLAGNPDRCADRVIGTRRQRQAALGRTHDRAIGGVDIEVGCALLHLLAQAESFSSRKYSRSLGIAYTVCPVRCSM